MVFEYLNKYVIVSIFLLVSCSSSQMLNYDGEWIESNHENIKIQFPKIVANIDLENKIKLIDELLKFKGNKDRSIPISNYNLLKSSRNLVKGYASLDICTLFMVNQVYFENPFIYSSMPVLRNKETGENSIQNPELINDAYDLYLKWFINIKNHKAQFGKMNPLENSKIEWHN